MKHFLFTYGSILLKEITERSMGFTFEPIKSVFIKGYKLEIKHANNEKNPNYHYILCNPTDNTNDIIPGFIVECSDEQLIRLDRWEGNSYERKQIICYDRNLQEIKCFIYLKNNSAA